MTPLFWVGYIIRALAGIWGFIVGFVVAAHLFGVPGALASILLFPVAITLGPLYATLAYGAWLHLVGPIVLGFVGLLLMGKGMEDEERRAR